MIESKNITIVCGSKKYIIIFDAKAPYKLVEDTIKRLKLCIESNDKNFIAFSNGLIKKIICLDPNGANTEWKYHSRKKKFYALNEILF